MIIGRTEEINLLKNAYSDDKSHFIAVYGRRRVGKTFLIRESFDYNFTFQHAGLSNGNLKAQLFAFCSSLKDSGCEFRRKPENWLEAFEGLKDVIRNSDEKKKVIFIDELSWMDTPKCDLMIALENFWNAFASARKDIVLIVCASATSWMLTKVVHNKGGLYNRLTEQINLQTFSLKECEEYIKANNLIFNRDQIIQYYMIFGGVPFYWGFLKKGLSIPQNVDNALFAANAPLKNEFEYLYASVFKNPEVYLKIIEALGTKKVGMCREEIIETAGIINSGDLTIKLKELESCGFIRKYHAFGMKTKNAVYQLIDNFTLFYYQFLKDYPTDENFWSHKINTPSGNNWKGLAFERICLEHIKQIKFKLGISGVHTEVNSWFCKKDETQGIFGSQIDLLIVRDDQVINLCEMKYYGADYAMSSKDDEDMRRKISDLTTVTKTHHAIYPTVITSYNLVQNGYAANIQSVVTSDDLFLC